MPPDRRWSSEPPEVRPWHPLDDGDVKDDNDDDDDDDDEDYCDDNDDDHNVNDDDGDRDDNDDEYWIFFQSIPTCLPFPLMCPDKIRYQ